MVFSLKERTVTLGTELVDKPKGIKLTHAVLLGLCPGLRVSLFVKVHLVGVGIVHRSRC